MYQVPKSLLQSHESNHKTNKQTKDDDRIEYEVSVLVVVVVVVVVVIVFFPPAGSSSSRRSRRSDELLVFEYCVRCCGEQRRGGGSRQGTFWVDCEEQRVAIAIGSIR